MSYKVIVADDSQTIQKVINITLAKQPYDLIECLSEEALFSELEKTKADLVCLDFNLSDKFSGPELAEKVKSLSPSTQIIFLLGTFDSVDDSTMKKCGAADKIVKPFDSNKFISLCKRLTHQEPGIALPPQETSSFDEVEAGWTMNDTVEKVLPQMDDVPQPINQGAEMNALDLEMSDWGMSVPGVINESDVGPMVDLPPVMDFPKETPAQIAKVQESFPSEEDLEYPTPVTPSESDLEYPEIKTPASDKLISLDEFKEYPEEIELEGSFVPEQSNINELEEMIKDEVEADLWKADEFEDLKEEIEQAVSSENLFQTDEEVFPRLDQDDVLPEMKFEETPIADSQSALSINQEEIEKMVEKYVKNYLDQLFSEKIEKIAWEMIPDLAENLIRSELKKISSKVLEDQD